MYSRSAVRYFLEGMAVLACIIVLVFSLFGVLPFACGAVIGGAFCLSLGVFLSLVLFDAIATLQIVIISPVAAVLCYPIFWFSYSFLWNMLNRQ